MARIDARELPALLRAIELYQGKHLTRLAIKMMALTFVRTSELIGARWEEFDLEAKRWMIPGMRMKMKTPHIVFLSRQRWRFLTCARLVGSCDLLFPASRTGTSPCPYDDPEGAGADGIQGRMTGTVSRLGIYHSSRARLHHEHIELQLAHAHATPSAPRTITPSIWSHAQDDAGLADFLERTQRGGRCCRFAGLRHSQSATRQPKIQPIFAI